jgi:polar amino acid transport system permease protein
MCPASQPAILHFLCLVVTLNQFFQWSAVGRFIFSVSILQGAVITVILAVISQFVGVVIGLILYFLRRSRLRPLRWIANGYIWIFRGTPLLLQILFSDVVFGFTGLYNKVEALDFFPHIGFPKVILSLFIEAWIALSLNEGAYMAEIVRAGIDAIDVGQMEAAKSVGMTYGLAMRRIVLPQAARIIIPPLGNEFNSMLKNTSLAEGIALWELLETADQLGSFSFLTLELLVVASVWYLAMTTGWTAIQAWIERKLNVSSLDVGPPDTGSYLSRVFGFGRRRVVGAGAPAEATTGAPLDRH